MDWPEALTAIVSICCIAGAVCVAAICYAGVAINRNTYEQDETHKKDEGDGFADHHRY